MSSVDEKIIQEAFPWERSQYFKEYNSMLGYYQIQSCLEYTHGRKSILDLPCGDGTLTALLCEKFDRVVGVDASSKHLIVAKENVSKAEFYESLIEDFSPTESFDNVIMLNILEHVLDPVSVLKKAASFLNDNGVLIVHVPNANAINRRIAVAMGTLESCEELSPFDINIAGHRRSYTLETLTKEFEAANMNIMKTGGVFYKMLSTPQIDWLLEKGPWEEGGFGWGRVGAEKSKNWKDAFCQACYEIGKERPEECNVIYIVAKANKTT